MKKQILAVLCALGVIASASSANAGCDGLYIGGKAGFVNHNMGDKRETFGDRIALDDNNWILGGAIGYRFGGYWRIEAEYIWREQQVDESTFYGAVSRSTFQSASYMANLYFDLSPYTMFTPYVVGGLGMTHIQREWSGTGRLTDNRNKNNFTWSLGAGLSAKMTNRWNIDLGYTFWHMGAFEHGTIRAHEVYMGMRYIFPM